jgi:hypothetical protein
VGGKLHCLIFTYADSGHYTTEKLSLADFFSGRDAVHLSRGVDRDYGGQVWGGLEARRDALCRVLCPSPPKIQDETKLVPTGLPCFLIVAGSVGWASRPSFLFHPLTHVPLFVIAIFRAGHLSNSVRTSKPRIEILVAKRPKSNKP